MRITLNTAPKSYNLPTTIRICLMLKCQIFCDTNFHNKYIYISLVVTQVRLKIETKSKKTNKKMTSTNSPFLMEVMQNGKVSPYSFLLGFHCIRGLGHSKWDSSFPPPHFLLFSYWAWEAITIIHYYEYYYHPMNIITNVNVQVVTNI